MEGRNKDVLDLVNFSKLSEMFGRTIRRDRGWKGKEVQIVRLLELVGMWYDEVFVDTKVSLDLLDIKINEGLVEGKENRVVLPHPLTKISNWLYYLDSEDRYYTRYLSRVAGFVVYEWSSREYAEAYLVKCGIEVE
jgi:hypothetical protein